MSLSRFGFGLGDTSSLVEQVGEPPHHKASECDQVPKNPIFGASLQSCPKVAERILPPRLPELLRWSSRRLSFLREWRQLQRKTTADRPNRCSLYLSSWCMLRTLGRCYLQRQICRIIGWRTGNHTAFLHKWLGVDVLPTLDSDFGCSEPSSITVNKCSKLF